MYFLAVGEYGITQPEAPMDFSKAIKELEAKRERQRNALETTEQMLTLFKEKGTNANAPTTREQTQKRA